MTDYEIFLGFLKRTDIKAEFGPHTIYEQGEWLSNGSEADGEGYEVCIGPNYQDDKVSDWGPFPWMSFSFNDDGSFMEWNSGVWGEVDVSYKGGVKQGAGK